MSSDTGEAAHALNSWFTFLCVFVYVAVSVL